jgi:hypothetical protein
LVSINKTQVAVAGRSRANTYDELELDEPLEPLPPRELDELELPEDPREDELLLLPDLPLPPLLPPRPPPFRFQSWFASGLSGSATAMALAAEVPRMRRERR